MTRIKLCGLKRPCDIEWANALMPDYIGLVFAKKSRRCVSPERAKALRESLDSGIRAVGVFVNEAPEAVAALLNEGIIDIAQLHGQEDDAYIAALRQALRAPDEKAIMKAFVVKGAEDVQAARETAADMVLLDAGLGGGEPFDWSLLDGFDRPYFLAGGLDAGNVAEALDRTGAAYVDTSSGIETDGKKDPEKMRAFAQAVRDWDAANPRLSFLESLHPEFHEEQEGDGELHPELN
jgi:phosphoribosylanthranilate isomerase